MHRKRRTLRLGFHLVDHRFSLEELIEELPNIHAAEAFRMRERFSMSSREQTFVRQLLRRKRNLWLFRCNQRLFCGDFIVVDMSPPVGAHRSAVVLELKARTPLKRGGGLQVRGAPEALAELVAKGVLDQSSGWSCWTGGEEEVLDWLGAAPL